MVISICALYYLLLALFDDLLMEWKASAVLFMNKKMNTNKFYVYMNNFGNGV